MTRLSRINRILFATDLSEGARFAFQRACELVVNTGASMCIVHAVDDAMGEDEKRSLTSSLRSQAASIIEELCGGEAEVSIHISSRDPEGAIFTNAEKLNPDLIVMGAHGAPRLRDVIFGSTAMRVLRGSCWPVLVVQNDASKPYRKALAAIDTTNMDEAMLRLCGTLIGDGEIFAVSAYEKGPLDGLDGPAALARYQAAHQQRLQHALNRVFADPDEPSKVFAMAEQGDALEIIMKSADSVGADLIAMSSRGRSGLPRLLQGSFAEFVLLGSPTDVLVVPLRKA